MSPSTTRSSTSCQDSTEMATEIERKFLVSGDGWKSDVKREMPIDQGYLVAERERTVRVRVRGGGSATLNVKGPTHGAARAEYEYEIPRDDALEILGICRRPIIEKTRHLVEHGGELWEIDVFEGANHGLRLAEIELDAESQQIDLPEWAGSEVTDDPRFFNAALVEHPYTDWPEQDR